MTTGLQNMIGVPLRDRHPDEIRERMAAASIAEETAAKFVRLLEYSQAQHPPLSISSLAARAKIGGSILSQCFNASYAGNYDNIGEKIDQFFWNQEQQALYGAQRAFVRTGIAQALYTLFNKVRITRRIQLVESEEQLGKSTIATNYAAEHNSGRTALVKISGGGRMGFGQFVWDLAEALGVPATLKMSEKRQRIRHALATCDLVIIDEWHNVWKWVPAAVVELLDYLRTDIHADGARGVVLISTNEDNLQRLQTLKKITNLGQFLGRMHTRVVRIDPGEDITSDDIRLLVSRYYEPGDSIVAELLEIAQRPQLGHLGLINDVVNEAWTTAKARKTKLTDRLVKEELANAMAELRELRGAA